jgi:carbon-monoxide dehydrogenase medium subunit
MKNGVSKPSHVIDIKHVGLDNIEIKNGCLYIGACCSLTKIEASTEIKQYFPAIIEACSFLASVQVRNRATLGGNICNAAPSADGVPPLLIYEARAVLGNGQSERELPLEQFFSGPGLTVLREDEILTSIVLPLPPACSASTYFKYSRTSKDLALAGVGAYLELDKQGLVAKVKLALGAVAPTPIRATKAEALLSGKRLTAELIGQAALEGISAASPISDVRSTAEYRREIIGALIKKSLLKCQNKIAGAERGQNI